MGHQHAFKDILQVLHKMMRWDELLAASSLDSSGQLPGCSNAGSGMIPLRRRYVLPYSPHRLLWAISNGQDSMTPSSSPSQQPSRITNNYLITESGSYTSGFWWMISLVSILFCFIMLKFFLKIWQSWYGSNMCYRATRSICGLKKTEIRWRFIIYWPFMLN